MERAKPKRKIINVLDRYFTDPRNFSSFEEHPDPLELMAQVFRIDGDVFAIASNRRERFCWSILRRRGLLPSRYSYSVRQSLMLARQIMVMMSSY
jgi:hypothetical protein